MLIPIWGEMIQFFTHIFQMNPEATKSTGFQNCVKKQLSWRQCEILPLDVKPLAVRRLQGDGVNLAARMKGRVTGGEISFREEHVCSGFFLLNVNS